MWCAAATLTAQYNNLDSVREVFAANKGEIAGVILEPVVGNSGYIAPNKDFLKVNIKFMQQGTCWLAAFVSRCSPVSMSAANEPKVVFAHNIIC